MVKEVIGREDTTFIVLLNGRVKLLSTELYSHDPFLIREASFLQYIAMWRLLTGGRAESVSGVLSPKWPSIQTPPSQASETSGKEPG